MSFSDFGSGASSSSSSTKKSTTQTTSAAILQSSTTTTTTTSLGGLDHHNNNNTTGSGSRALSAISDALLQYQRNVGILEKIVQSFGGSSSSSSSSSSSNTGNQGGMNNNNYSNNNNETILQYEAQNHVLMQLEEKLKNLLRQQPSSMNQTAIIKLKRDFEKVQIRVKQLQDMATTKIATIQQQQKSSSTVGGTATNNNTMPFFLSDTNTTNTGDDNDTILHQYQQQQQLQLQEDRLQEEIMREREEEIRNINRGMHTVNEIYKDLAHIVSQQQGDIDQIETQMDMAQTHAQQGLQQVEKANEKYGQSNCTIM